MFMQKIHFGFVGSKINWRLVLNRKNVDILSFFTIKSGKKKNRFIATQY